MQVIYYFGLILVVLTLLILLSRSRRRKLKKKNKPRRESIQPPPFEIRAFPNSECTKEMACEDATSNDCAYLTYISVYKQLLQGTPVSDVTHLNCFLSGPDTAEKNSDPLKLFLTTGFHTNVLHSYLAREFERCLSTSIKTGVVLHWAVGYLGEAALVAFQRTGEVRYIELYRSFFERLMMLRDSQLGYHDDYHQKTMDSWGAFNLGENSGKPGLWVAHVTLFAVCSMPAIGFSREILKDTGLAQHNDWAHDVAAFFESAYRQFDVDYRDVEGEGSRWYWRPLLEKYEATNHLHLLGQALLDLYAITRNEEYADRIRQILGIFEKGVVIHDDGLASWKYSPYFQVENEMNGHISRQFSEYSRKGEITVPFLYMAKQDGFDMGSDVLEAVTASIRDHILADADYKLHVHPKHSRAIRPRDRKKETCLEAGVSGYHVAAKDDPVIEKLVVDLVAENAQKFPQAWFSTPRLARSYARLLPRKS